MSQYELISTIIAKFGGRIAGKPNSIAAQKYVAGLLQTHCHQVEEEPISVAMDAKFGSLRIFTLVFLLSIGLYWVSLPVAAAVAAVNAICFIGHFVAYFDWLDFLYPKENDLNIIGTIEPKEEVKQTILVAGHIDSVYEFRWWYKWKAFGGYLSLIAGLIISLYPIFLGLSLLVSSSGASALQDVSWFIFALLAPTQVVFFFIHDKSRVVEGASDNLSGVAIAWAVARRYGKEGTHRLKHTRLRLISFAAEEPGLKGSREYAKRHAAELREENAILLNADTIRLREEITILKGESNCFVKYPPELIGELEKSFANANVAVKQDWLQMGASDAVSLQRKGIPSVTVVGINTRKFDPCYHTRLDTVENLDPEGMARVSSAFFNLIERRDQAAASS